jgi:hypothetical protein
VQQPLEASVQHQIGRIDIIAWQAKPARDGARRRHLLSLALLALGGLSLTIIALRFLLGFPISMPLLQTAFAALVVSAALLVMQAAVFILLRLQDR